MKIDVFRGNYFPNATPGKLSVDGIFECYTVELPNRNNLPDQSCIPEGVYDLAWNFSHVHQRYMVELLNVPRRSGIRIDVANFPHQLLGCIAVGNQGADDSVMESQAAYDVLIPKIHETIQAGGQVSLEVHAPAIT